MSESDPYRNPLRDRAAPPAVGVTGETPVAVASTNPPAEPDVPAEPLVVEPEINPPVEPDVLAEPPVEEPEINPPAAPSSTSLADASLAMRSGKGARKGSADFDPIKENGPIFEGWTKPDLALMISGRMHGYFEPCGCSGLEKMKGGLSRRQSLAEELRDKGWPLVLVDAGGLAKGFGAQTNIKYHHTVDALRKIGYHGIGLGKTDLRLPAGELVADAAGDDSPILSASVGLFGFATETPAACKVVEAGGYRVGIVGVIGKAEQAQISNPELELLAPEAALAKMVPELQKKADLLVLLADADKEETIALAKQFPVFAVAVTTGGGYEPPNDAAVVEGTTTRLVETGEKGMNAVVVGFNRDAQPAFRYQRVPLDSRFPGTKQMYQVMAAYQFQLEELGWDGLGLKPVPNPRSELLGKYVGSQACATCHEYSYKAWRMTWHSRGYSTLAKLDPPRIHDPECISCHVVGWHPTECFPYVSGFDSLEKTPELTDVGCETCHGPGEAHIAAESGANKKLQEQIYEAMRVTKEQADQAVCRGCHDLDNSPAFQFETYWPQVEHYEDKAWFDAWRAKQPAPTE